MYETLKMSDFAEKIMGIIIFSISLGIFNANFLFFFTILFFYTKKVLRDLLKIVPTKGAV